MHGDFHLLKMPDGRCRIMIGGQGPWTGFYTRHPTTGSYESLFVIPEKARIQATLLDPGQKHAGMTIGRSR